MDVLLSSYEILRRKQARKAGRLMGNPAARMGDKVLQDSPHCHAPIHPAAPVPTPVPHPALPLDIIKGDPTVMIGNKPAARMTDMTAPCSLPGCVPGGPGMIMK